MRDALKKFHIRTCVAMRSAATGLRTTAHCAPSSKPTPPSRRATILLTGSRTVAKSDTNTLRECQSSDEAASVLLDTPSRP